MLALLPADEIDRSRLAARLWPIAPSDERKVLDDLVSDNSLTVSTIIWDGERVGALWWRVNPRQKTLLCLAGASFSPQPHTEAFLAAYHRLAKQFGCRCIEMETRRAGLARAYAPYGFKVDAVVLRKHLC